MAVDKLVDSTQLDIDLTSVANAIRIKGGTSGQMAFPAGFVSAIGDIETGITPTGTKQISITANGTTTEDVAAYANAEITVDVQGGGASAQIATGTFTGNDTQYASFACSFEPDAVYIIRINIVSLSERVFAGFIGGTFGSHAGNAFFQCNANTTGISIFGGDMASRKFTYSNNTVTAASQTTRPVSSACEYAYYAVKWTQ